MAKQVFYDPLQARWRRIRRIVDAAALALRLFFFIYFPMVTDDSRIYADLAGNWLRPARTARRRPGGREEYRGKCKDRSDRRTTGWVAASLWP